MKHREYKGKYRLLEWSDQRELWSRTCSMDEEDGNMYKILAGRPDVMKALLMFSRE
jgi:hypothetical protein